MGVVYRAEDLTLHRPVALKFLPSTVAASEPDRARLLQEARAASSVDHPNVCTVYEVGETPEGELFLAMALYEGETLREKTARGPLPLQEALTIAIQIADGLHAAHEQGVVHRDIKSENIFVTARGLVKIMDFGLARGKMASGLTVAGTTLGTLPYMSPEQACGDPVDQRTDIWSLGVVMYEMLSGRLPFRSDYADALVYAILNEQPPPLSSLRQDVSPDIERIVSRALAKSQQERYQNVAALLADLRASVTAGPARPESQVSTVTTTRPRKRLLVPFVSFVVVVLLLVAAYAIFFRSPASTAPRSIAVLPFQNLSDSKDDEYLSDGITQSITTDLARRKGLLVISRNSSFKFKGQGVDARQAAQELGVGYVLEGSVQRSGGTLRVNAQLIDASTGFQVWADRYDRDKKDLFALQDDIAGRIVSALAVTVSAGERPAGQQAANPEAYDALLRGEFFMQAPTSTASFDSAIFHIQESIRLDPGFARAYAALGNAYSWVVFNIDPSQANEQKAYVAIEKALALDSTLAYAYIARASLLWTRLNGFPHERALQEYRRAVRFDPNSSAAYEGIGSIYFHIGLLDKARQALRTAIAIDPLSTFSQGRVARSFWYEQQFDSALAQFARIPEQTNWDYEHAVVLHDLGRDEEAFALLNVRPGTFRDSVRMDEAAVLAVISAGRGEAELADRYIQLAYDRGHNTSHFHHAEFFIACANALLHRPEKAVEWLRKTADDGLPCYPLFKNDPNLKNLATDSDYQALLARLKEQWDYYRTNL
jgi:eukaryotic-like serine/threonine-protein kinase